MQYYMARKGCMYWNLKINYSNVDLMFVVGESEMDKIKWNKTHCYRPTTISPYINVK